MKPSLTAFKTPGVTRQFGIPPSGINPLPPPLELFVYDTNSISPLGKPDLEELIPAPSAPPLPEGEGKFPQAPVYKLAVDPGYRRGYIYTADFNLVDKMIEHENMLNIQPPLNVKPARFNKKTQMFESDPISWNGPGTLGNPTCAPYRRRPEASADSRLRSQLGISQSIRRGTESGSSDATVLGTRLGHKDSPGDIQSCWAKAESALQKESQYTAGWGWLIQSCFHSWRRRGGGYGFPCCPVKNCRGRAGYP
ncbi:hypothetical protein B0H14DRAFT_359247 [Mycena olivaceomarginata]|nr:hypothetical protein B0H14DRAFT_359247 [Mycena olivaceomarginata]